MNAREEELVVVDLSGQRLDDVRAAVEAVGVGRPGRLILRGCHFGEGVLRGLGMALGAAPWPLEVDLCATQLNDWELDSFVASMGHFPRKFLLPAEHSAEQRRRLCSLAPAVAMLSWGGSFDQDSQFVRGSKMDFAAVAQLVQQDRQHEIFGVRSDIDDSPDPNGAEGSRSTMERPKKPWEKSK